MLLWKLDVLLSIASYLYFLSGSKLDVCCYGYFLYVCVTMVAGWYTVCCYGNFSSTLCTSVLQLQQLLIVCSGISWFTFCMCCSKLVHCLYVLLKQLGIYSVCCYNNLTGFLYGSPVSGILILGLSIPLLQYAVL